MAQQAALVAGYRDEHRLTIREAGACEFLDLRQVLTLIAVEEHHVAEATIDGRGIRHPCASRSLPGHHTRATSPKLPG